MQLAQSTLDFNHKIMPFEDRPDATRWAGDEVARVQWAFTTRDGSWDVNAEKPGGIEQPFRDRFLKAPDDPEYCDIGGGDHNFICALLQQDGKLKVDKTFFYWQGISNLNKSASEFDQYLTSENGAVRKSNAHGWADIPVWGSYDPATQIAPWCGTVLAPADVYYGIAMPWNWHISTFVIWQMEPRTTVPGTPNTGDPVALQAVVDQLAKMNAKWERFLKVLEI